MYNNSRVISMKPFYERYWKAKEELGDFSYKWPVIKQLMPKIPKIALLDFGCGKGKILGEILKINPTIKAYGADVSDRAISFVKRKYPHCSFVVHEEGKRFPFKSNFFDFITALDVMEHVYDTETTFKELARVLKPGGFLLVSVPYNGFIKNVVIALFFFDFFYDPYTPHIRFYTRKSLVRCINKAGLHNVKFGYYGSFFPVWKGMYILAKK